jgi:hypothetical protein
MNLLIKAAEIYTPGRMKTEKLRELFACTADAFACEMPPVEGLTFVRLLQAYASFTATQAEQVLVKEGDIAGDLPRAGGSGPGCEAISARADQEIASLSAYREDARRADPLAMTAKSVSSTAHPAERDGRLTMTKSAPAPGLAEVQHRLFENACRMGEELRRTFRVTSPAEGFAAARVLYRGLGIDLQATPDGEITVHRCFFSSYYSAPVCRLIASLDAGVFAGLLDGGCLAFSERITEGHGCCRAHFSRTA